MRRLLPIVFFLATSALAQPPHAMLTGTARSARRPVGGVAVTLSSASLQGTRTTTTVVNGDYFFDALPPGPYDIRFAKQGYATVTHRGVLKVAQITRVDADLQPSQEEESITATSTTTTVLETPQIATTLDAALIDQLPIRREISDRTTLAPGEAGAFRLNVVDGMLLPTFSPFPDVVEDSIDQTTVITGAAGPEYGRTIGGTVITLTRPGGNDLSGSIRDTLTSDRWQARRTRTGRSSSAIDHSLEATLGGRIIADRIWFFLAGGHLHGEPTPFERVTVAREQAKITAAPTSVMSVVATYLHADSRGDFAGHENAGSVDATTMAGDHTLIEAMVSRTTLFTSRDILLRGSWLGGDRLGGSHTITAGFSDTSLSFTPLSERALFANDRFHYGRHWLFNAGARIVDIPSTEAVFEPRLSAIFDTHGDGHSRWSLSWGQYLDVSYLVPPEVNETTLSYAMQIGGNGFIRFDGWHRQGRTHTDGIDFQGSYRFLGIFDAGGNFTWQNESHDRANVWLRFGIPGNLTAGILYQTPATGVSLNYALPVAPATLFAKADLLNAFDVRHATPREFRIGLGARF